MWMQGDVFENQTEWGGATVSMPQSLLEVLEAIWASAKRQEHH